eukprot:TRINITY_DN4548_c0_g1_i1.p1 TRINITY_DN4548_c0_g1~~TRINITY_DN4548_c0_g1_i1.p1  ORF type:complete len:362 (-),score=162.85 TRINITY_DN4548_c0_g1_i1:143-1228(-)
MQSDNEKKLVFSILEYLQSLANKEGHDSESLEVASQCISSEFGLDVNSTDDKSKYSVAPLTLLEIFTQSLPQQTRSAPKKPDFGSPALNERFEKFLAYLIDKKDFFKNCTEGTPEYELRFERAKAAFLEQQKTEAPQVDVAKAEEFKLEGNKLLTSKQFEGAIEKYTEAIKYNSNNAIYYSNRAAAYSHLEQHDKAIEDCKQSITVDPNYIKAYTRLGLAYFSLGKYAEAVEQYKIALSKDPSNGDIQDALEQAQDRLSPTAVSDANPAGGLDALLNNPDIANLANQFRGAGGAGGAGGMPDIASLLSNPGLMAAAQNAMSQPGFAEMLNNPAMRNMAQQMMQNPEALSGLMSGLMPPKNN